MLVCQVCAPRLPSRKTERCNGLLRKVIEGKVIEVMQAAKLTVVNIILVLVSAISSIVIDIPLLCINQFITVR